MPPFPLVPSRAALFVSLLAAGCSDYSFSNLPDDQQTPPEPAPKLQITPRNHLFSPVLTGCDTSLTVALSNIGEEPLSIDSVAYGSDGMLLLDDGGLELPVLLGPGEAVEVEVLFDASEVGSDVGALVVGSNDPRGQQIGYQLGQVLDPLGITEVFSGGDVVEVDVLWAIDQSRSMSGDNQDDIRQGVPDFLAELSQLADFHLIQVTRDTGCTNVGVITNTTANAEALLIANAFDDEDRRDLSTTEQLLMQVDMALQQTEPGGCNEGFLRPGAQLHVVVASDEQDRSPEDHVHWLDRYRDYVTMPDLLTVSAVVDVDRQCGDGSGGGEYLAAAEATGGMVLDICDPSWGSQMEQLATQTIRVPDAYTLREQPVPGTLRVTVEDQATVFTYDAETNSIEVVSPPVSGTDRVVVTYDAVHACSE